MLRQIKMAYARSHKTLLQDSFDAAMIVLFLLIALHLPTFW